MRVALRKFLLFLPDFRAILYFFLRANCCGLQSKKGEEWRFATNEGGLLECHRALFGGGGIVKFIVTQPKFVSSDPTFRPWHLKHSHPVGKKYHCVRRYTTFTCYLQLSRTPRPCSSQCVKTNWKPQETKQHHSTERDRNGNQLEALSSCNLRKKEKQMTNVALLPS